MKRKKAKLSFNKEYRLYKSELVKMSKQKLSKSFKCAQKDVEFMLHLLFHGAGDDFITEFSEMVKNQEASFRKFVKEQFDKIHNPQKQLKHNGAVNEQHN